MLNATIENNIRIGSSVSDEDYHKAIYATALDKDLQEWVGGIGTIKTYRSVLGYKD